MVLQVCRAGCTASLDLGGVIPHTEPLSHAPIASETGWTDEHTDQDEPDEWWHADAMGQRDDRDRQTADDRRVAEYAQVVHRGCPQVCNEALGRC